MIGGFAIGQARGGSGLETGASVVFRAAGGGVIGGGDATAGGEVLCGGASTPRAAARGWATVTGGTVVETAVDGWTGVAPRADVPGVGRRSRTPGDDAGVVPDVGVGTPTELAVTRSTARRAGAGQ
jgi:hypothetical protein